MSKGVTFYLMRHGETYLNYFERMQGWSNAPLTERGIEDVHRSGRGLSDVKFDAVYTSDLMRTIQTAEIVLKENKSSDNLVIKPMQEFREVHFGYFEGLQVEKYWPEILDEAKKIMKNPNDVSEQTVATLNIIKKKDPSGLAENYAEFWERVEGGLLKLLYKHAGTDQNILVVCHGLTIRNIVHGLVSEVPEDMLLSNASVTTVKYVNGQFELLGYNETSHFKDLIEVTENA